MKKILFLVALIFAGVSVGANSLTDTNPAVMAIDQNEKYITQDELPEAVQTALKGDDYKGWSVSSIAKVEGQPGTDGAKGKAHYKVQVTNGTEVKTVKLDENGKKVA